MKSMILILDIQVYSGKSGLFVVINDKISILLYVDIQNNNIPNRKFTTENNSSQILLHVSGFRFQVCVIILNQEPVICKSAKSVFY